MRFQLIIFCLVISSLLIAQQNDTQTKDVQIFSSDLSLQNKDSIPVEKKNLTEEKKDSLIINLSRKKRFIPYFKSIDEVSIKDYKLLFLDESEKTVDTSLVHLKPCNMFKYKPVPLPPALQLPACPGEQPSRCNYTMDKVYKRNNNN